MNSQELNNLKKWADFAVSLFYQQELKPFFNELLESQYKELDIEAKSEFECMKRDIKLWAFKMSIRMIKDKIDKAPEQVNRELKIKIGKPK